MDFQEFIGRRHTFTANMDIDEAEQRLKEHSVGAVRKHLDLTLDRHDHCTNFQIDRRVSGNWVIVASGVLELRETDITSVTFHTRLAQKRMMVSALLIMALGWGLIPP